MTMEIDHLRNNYLQLGVAACKAGQLEQSARFLNAGIQEAERLNLRDLGTAALFYNLAVVYQKQDITNDIEMLLHKCLKLCRQYGGKDHPTLPLVSRLLADHYYKTGNLSSARFHYNEALKAQSLSAAEQLDYLMHLVHIEHARAKHENVQKICHQIYAMQEEHFAQLAKPMSHSHSSVPAVLPS